MSRAARGSTRTTCDANAQRYYRESLEKLPGAKSSMPPKVFHRFMGWYFDRIYVHVWPERVYVWDDGDPTKEPTLYDSRLEEVRSGHSEEPEAEHPGPEDPARASWDPRMDELGDRYPSAVITLVSPDGFPFSLRVPVDVDKDARRVRIATDALGVPMQPGLACLSAHDHAPDFTWQRNFQVRGDLVEDADGWAIVPHKLIGGFELPPTGMVARTRQNWKKMQRFRKIHKQRATK